MKRILDHLKKKNPTDFIPLVEAFQLEFTLGSIIKNATKNRTKNTVDIAALAVHISIFDDTITQIEPTADQKSQLLKKLSDFLAQNDEHLSEPQKKIIETTCSFKIGEIDKKTFYTTIKAYVLELLEQAPSTKERIENFFSVIKD